MEESRSSEDFKITELEMKDDSMLLANTPTPPPNNPTRISDAPLFRPPTLRELEGVSPQWRPYIGDVLWDADTIAAKVRQMGEHVSSVYATTNTEDVLVVPILKGAFIFAADLMRQFRFKFEVDFLNCSSYGSSTETCGRVDLLSPLRTSVRGRDVLIIEDLIDSGLTLDFARKHLLALEPASLRICVLFNKHGRRKAGIDIPVDFFGWDCPNRFIVGYGMDYAQHYRCLPFVCVLKPEAYTTPKPPPPPLPLPVPIVLLPQEGASNDKEKSQSV